MIVHTVSTVAQLIMVKIVHIALIKRIDMGQEITSVYGVALQAMVMAAYIVRLRFTKNNYLS